MPSTLSPTLAGRRLSTADRLPEPPADRVLAPPPWRLWLAAGFLAVLALLALAAPDLARAEPRNPGTESSVRRSIEPAMLVLFNRDIVELRGSLGGLEPAKRAERARTRFNRLTGEELASPVALRPASLDEGSGYAVLAGERHLFTVLQSDLDPEERLSLREAAERARRHVQDATDARRAQGAPLLWLKGLAVVLGSLLLFSLGLAVVWRLRTWLLARAQLADPGLATYLRVGALRLAALLLWPTLLTLVWALVVATLAAFPWTQPWGDRLTDFVRQLGGWLVAGTLGAIPGLVTIALVLLVARIVHDLLRHALEQVQSGRVQVPLLHAETVGATRRLLAVLVWGVAAAIAYPYLPGSDSDAFKGLSVLFGLMLTLGSTGVVTQLMSGLVIVYSRSLKSGDFIAVNGVEGVVREVGALAVKVVNMRNEEITLPHSVITANAIHNYSKLSGQQGTLVSTKVTIGYDTPWRQVHAMLVNAASRTPGVRTQPPPFVYQRALSDFYVEYELFAHIDKPLERVPILSAIHAAIQDEFNTYGVQIMSPHFYEQPAQALVVAREKWFDAPARPPNLGPSDGS
jgi:small-conductance mechanosensitive channel